MDIISEDHVSALNMSDTALHLLDSELYEQTFDNNIDNPDYNTNLNSNRSNDSQSSDQSIPNVNKFDDILNRELLLDHLESNLSNANDTFDNFTVSNSSNNNESRDPNEIFKAKSKSIFKSFKKFVNNKLNLAQDSPHESNNGTEESCNASNDTNSTTNESYNTNDELCNINDEFDNLEDESNSLADGSKNCSNESDNSDEESEDIANIPVDYNNYSSILNVESNNSLTSIDKCSNSSELSTNSHSNIDSHIFDNPSLNEQFIYTDINKPNYKQVNNILDNNINSDKILYSNCQNLNYENSKIQDITEKSSNHEYVQLDKVDSSKIEIGESEDLAKLITHDNLNTDLGSKSSGTQNLDFKKGDILELKAEDGSQIVNITEYSESNSTLIMNDVSMTKISENLDKDNKNLHIMIETLHKEVIQLKSSLKKQDSLHQNEIQILNANHSSKIEQLKKMSEEFRKEKDSMVMRYAQSERKYGQLQENYNKLDRKLREWTKERDNMAARWNSLRSENNRMVKILESQDSEISSLRKEVEYQKELATSADLQAKFYQQKSREEKEICKDARNKFDEVTDLIMSERNEILNLAQDIKVLYNSCNSFDLKNAIVFNFNLDLFNLKKIENSQNKMILEIGRDLLLVRDTLKKFIELIMNLTDKNRLIEKDFDNEKQIRIKLDDKFKKRDLEAAELTLKLSEAEICKREMSSELDRIRILLADKDSAEKMRVEVGEEIRLARERETANLESISRITESCATFQTQNASLSSEVENLTKENADLLFKCSQLELENKDLIASNLDLSQQSKSTILQLKEELDMVNKQVIELRQQLNDALDLLKSQKRQHLANIKDLTKQLQASKKALDNFNYNDDHVSIGQDNAGGSGRVSPSLKSTASTSSGEQTIHCNENHVSEDDMLSAPTVRVIEVDRQMLVERIVKLQRLNARKIERIEFLDDHIKLLTDEIRKKSKIIENYIRREESGTMSSNVSDSVKLQMAKKGGIMSSLFNANSRDEKMTLDKALEISQKLQAVLEDTILKNIALKESIEVLGKEIDCLNKEKENLMRPNLQSFQQNQLLDL